MDQFIYCLKIIRNVVFMWSISLGFLMLMTFVSYKLRVSSAVIYMMIVTAYILGGITGGLFSCSIWAAIWSGAAFIVSIKLAEAICGKGDIYHQNFVIYILIMVAAIFGYYIKK